MALLFACCGLSFSSCSKDAYDDEEQAADEQAMGTRAEFHWICKGEKCFFINSSHRDKCLVCEGDRPQKNHQPENFLDDIENFGGGPGVTVGPGSTGGGENWIPLLSWFEQPKALRFYNWIKNTVEYQTSSSYAYGIDCAWHELTRNILTRQDNLVVAKNKCDNFATTYIGSNNDIRAGVIDGAIIVFDAFRSTYVHIEEMDPPGTGTIGGPINGDLL